MTVTTEQQVDPVFQGLMNSLAPMTQMSPYLRLLIYGEPGVGKTLLAAGAPAPLYVDVDKNMAPIFGFPELTQKIIRYEFTTIEQFEQLVAYLKAGYFQNAQTVVIDKITDVAFIALQQIAIRQAQLRGSNPLKVETDDRVESNERIRRILFDLKTIEKNLVVIASAKTIESAHTSVKTTMPEFSERLVGHITAMFNMVGYMYREEDGTGEITRLLRTQPLPNIIAKSFTSNIPPVMMNPTWDQIYSAYSTMRQQSIQG